MVEVQATAEHQPFDDAQLVQMMSLARAGIESLVAQQRLLLEKLESGEIGSPLCGHASIARPSP